MIFIIELFEAAHSSRGTRKLRGTLHIGYATRHSVPISISVSELRFTHPLAAKLVWTKNMTLTDQELEAAYLARLDLGTGYPQLDLPKYVRDLYLDDSSGDICLQFSPHWSPEKQALIDQDLISSLKQFLDVSSAPDHLAYVTFSGSIALDRALASTQIIAARHKRKKIHVVTTTPCIDIMRLFLEERTGVTTHFLHSKKNGAFGIIDEDAFYGTISELSKKYPSDQICVLISSPENPTGEVWHRDKLNTLISICKIHDAVLIIDHCFVTAGLHSFNDIDKIWNLANKDLMWMAVWDTGKTFGLNEDKLGFLLTNSPFVGNAINQALAVLQFGVSRRSKIFFAGLLKKALHYNYVEHIREVCKLNYNTLASAKDNCFVAREPHAGSLALVDISGTGRTDEQIRSALIAKKIGVVSGNVFFHTTWKKNNFIRIALARQPEYFEDAIEALLRSLPRK